MINYHTFPLAQPVAGAAEATCEGGAGWIHGHPAPQMTVGGWDALVAARAAGRNLPPIDVSKARAYWSMCADGEVVLSNLYEDRFDFYHGQQTAIALQLAKNRGLIVGHYGFPSFAKIPTADQFWNQIKYSVSILTPGYYANFDDNEDQWSSVDYERMAFQVSQASRYAAEVRALVGFVVNPETHPQPGGTAKKPLKPAKQKLQLALLEALGVQVVFTWSDSQDEALKRASVQLAASLNAVPTGSEN